MLVLIGLLIANTMLNGAKATCTVLYMEPSYCRHDITLDDGEELCLESSHGTNTDNTMGICEVLIKSANHSMHLSYEFELGPFITDCSAELSFANDDEDTDEKSYLPRYTCDDLHPFKRPHAANWSGKVTVKRAYITRRRDFYFKLKVVQVYASPDHDDDELGIYFDQEMEDYSSNAFFWILPFVIIIPSVIFYINEADSDCCANVNPRTAIAAGARRLSGARCSAQGEQPDPETLVGDGDEAEVNGSPEDNAGPSGSGSPPNGMQGVEAENEADDNAGSSDAGSPARRPAEEGNSTGDAADTSDGSQEFANTFSRWKFS